MRKSTFVSNILTVSRGKLFALALPIITTPIISRLFSPSDFGAFSFFLSIVTIISTASSLRFPVASVLPKEEIVADRLTLLSILAGSGVSLLVLIVLGVCYSFSPDWITEKLGYWVWAIPVWVFLYSIDDALSMWLVRHGKFRPMALSDSVEPIATTGSRIGIGYLTGSSLSGLIIGFAFGRLLRLGVICKASWTWIKKSKTLAAPKQLWETVIEYKNYPLFNTPTSLVFAFSNNLPFILLGIIYAPEVLGYYAMANRLLRMPIQTVSETIRKVFLRKAAGIRNESGDLAPYIVKLGGGLALAGALPFLFLYIYAEDLLTHFLGMNWGAAGNVASILAPWLFLVWVSTPCSVVVEVCNKQPQWMRQQILILIARLVVFYCAVEFGKDYTWTLQWFVFVSSVGVIVNLIQMYFWAKSDNKSGSTAQR